MIVFNPQENVWNFTKTIWIGDYSDIHIEAETAERFFRKVRYKRSEADIPQYGAFSVDNEWNILLLPDKETGGPELFITGAEALVFIDLVREELEKRSAALAKMLNKLKRKMKNRSSCAVAQDK